MGRIQLKPRCFQQAKILHRDGKRISELLHLGAARIMDDARVSGSERSTKSPRREFGDQRAEFVQLGGPGKCATPCQGCRTDGVETETDVDVARRSTLIARHCCDIVDRLNGLEPQIEIDPYAGSKVDALERASDCIAFRRREAVSVRSYCSGKFNREIGRAVCKIIACLCICARRIRVLQARHDCPGRARRASDDRARLRLAPTQRLDAQAVVGFADKPALKRGAFECAVNQSSPFVPRSRGKLSGKREIRLSAVRHGSTRWLNPSGSPARPWYKLPAAQYWRDGQHRAG